MVLLSGRMHEIVPRDLNKWRINKLMQLHDRNLVRTVTLGDTTPYKQPTICHQLY